MPQLTEVSGFLSGMLQVNLVKVTGELITAGGRQGDQSGSKCSQNSSSLPSLASGNLLSTGCYASFVSQALANTAGQGAVLVVFSSLLLGQGSVVSHPRSVALPLTYAQAFSDLRCRALLMAKAALLC